MNAIILRLGKDRQKNMFKMSIREISSRMCHKICSFVFRGCMQMIQSREVTGIRKGNMVSYQESPEWLD